MVSVRMIHANGVLAVQMCEDHVVVDRQERFARALGTPGLRLPREVDEPAKREADVLSRILAVPGVQQIADCPRGHS
jgi:hypothetical protein